MLKTMVEEVEEMLWHSPNSTAGPPNECQSWRLAGASNVRLYRYKVRNQKKRNVPQHHQLQTYRMYECGIDQASL